MCDNNRGEAPVVGQSAAFEMVGHESAHDKHGKDLVRHAIFRHAVDTRL